MKRAVAIPVAAGLAAAAATFAVVMLVGAGDERGSAPPARAEAAPAGGRALFLEMGCGSCHRFADAGSTGTIGPDLDERLAGHDRASLSATILAPPGSGGTAFTVMPDNFGERMDGRELDALVGYLLAVRRRS